MLFVCPSCQRDIYHMLRVCVYYARVTDFWVKYLSLGGDASQRRVCYLT